MIATLSRSKFKHKLTEKLAVKLLKANKNELLKNVDCEDAAKLYDEILSHDLKVQGLLKLIPK